MSRVARLHELLDRLEPVDALEREHKVRTLALLGAAGDPFDREHYGPGHVTVSAFIVDAARENLLLILHGKLGRWLQPGGHVDGGDSDVAAAARREVLEETGLVVHGEPEVLDVDVHAIPARPGAPAHEHFDVRFLFEAGSGAPRAGSDARQVRWVPIEALLRGASDLPTDESVMRAVRKLRARRA